MGYRARLQCPACQSKGDWHIQISNNWFIRCYNCGAEYDLEREKRPKQQKSVRKQKRKQRLRRLFV